MSIRTPPWAVFFCLLPWAAAACGSAEAGPPAVGEVIPDVGGVTLAGDSIALSDLRGSPLVVNLWATWCAPCRHETPYLQSVHERFSPAGLRMVGITVDGRNARKDVAGFLEEMGVTYTILHDPSMRSMDVLYVIGLPATYVVDAEGRIRFFRNGPVLEGDEAFEGAVAEVVGGETP